MSIVLESTKRVTEKSDHVSISTEAVKAWAENFPDKNTAHWLEKAPFDISGLKERDRLHLILVLNAISFSYWDDEKWTMDYKGEKIDGAYGMIAALGRAFEEKAPITDFRYLAEMPESDFKEILRGEGTIPLFENRLKILREVGSVLSSKFNGDLTQLIQSVDSADELLEKIITLLFQR